MYTYFTLPSSFYSFTEVRWIIVYSLYLLTDASFSRSFLNLLTRHPMDSPVRVVVVPAQLPTVASTDQWVAPPDKRRGQLIQTPDLCLDHPAPHHRCLDLGPGPSLPPWVPGQDSHRGHHQPDLDHHQEGPPKAVCQQGITTERNPVIWMLDTRRTHPHHMVSSLSCFRRLWG